MRNVNASVKCVVRVKKIIVGSSVYVGFLAHSGSDHENIIIITIIKIKWAI